MIIHTAALLIYSLGIATIASHYGGKPFMATLLAVWFGAWIVVAIAGIIRAHHRKGL